MNAVPDTERATHTGAAHNTAEAPRQVANSHETSALTWWSVLTA